MLINARTVSDFIRAGKLLKQLPEDFAKYEKPYGRNHGIAYGQPGELTIYAWRTQNQVAIHFEKEE